MIQGRLVLVATPIGNLGDMTLRATEVLATADVLACEDTRRVRALLSHLGISAGSRLLAVHGHNEAGKVDGILGCLERGQTVAVVTDAGTPAVSDPGFRLVAAAVAAGHTVVAVPGPSAVLAALVVSGMDPTRFCFEGFLPRSGCDRRRAIQALVRERRTVVIFESPKRVAATITELADRLGGSRRVALARELTKKHEEVWRGDLAGAAVHLAETSARGEFVVVIEGAEAPAPPTDMAIEAALSRHRDMGESRRQAMTEVIAELDAPRNQVYRVATELSFEDTRRNP